MASQALATFTPLTRRPLLASVTAAVTTTLLVWAFRDYRAYIALGPGGVPHNFAGWLLVTLGIRPFALSKASATWTGDYPEDGYHEEIGNIPQRKGERAVLGGIVPHRQLSQQAPERMREFIQNLFANAVAQNPSLLESKLSIYERNNPALFVSQNLLTPPAATTTTTSTTSVPQTALTARGEIAHHHGDLSVHMYLSPADAKVAIERGWAERHRLALPQTSLFANRFHVADSYVMVYGPRDEEEMEVLAVIFRNGIRFMTGREDVEGVEWRRRINA